MAGISGTIDLRGGLEPGEPVVRRMLATIAHRGPDGEIAVADGPAVLGVRFQTWLDGPAPLPAEAGLLLALDGDLVNLPELATALAASGGSSQAELLLAAWRRWGPACLDRLEGSFAFALWDGGSRRLHLVRDRIGLRPLYYAVAGGRLRFASEIKALLADPAVPRVPNDERVLQYLAHGIADHTDETMLRTIRQVPPGGRAEASPCGVDSVRTWYRPRSAPAAGPVPERVRDLLQDAVALRLRGRGAVGVALSGGLDSTSVLAVAARLRQEAGEPPPLAVVARTADPRLDEWRWAELLLRRYEVPSVQLRLADGDLVHDFERFARSLDEPVHSPSVYGHWRVMQATREAGLDVVLEGQSGERFGGLGYWYPQLFYDMLRRGRLGSFARELRARGRVQGVPASRSLTDLAKLLAPRRLRAAHAHRPAWLAPGLPVDPPPLPRRGLLGQQVYEMTVVDLPLLCREVDRDASSFALAERAPFQDRRIVEYALSLPAETLHRNGVGKAPLVDAMRGLVPDEILDRPTKQGFTVDEDRWLAGSFGDEIARVFRSEAAQSRPYWDANAVLQLLEECRAGRASAAGLWRAYSVERWLELVVDGAPPESVPEPAVAGARRASTSS